MQTVKKWKQLKLAKLSLLLLTASCDTQFLQQEKNDPNYESETFRAAKQRFELRDYHSAIQLYYQALRENPNMARAHFHLGLIYDERLGDYVSAIYHYKQFLRLKPDCPEVESVKKWIRRAELAFAAQIPNSPIENKEEVTKLQRENIQLQSELIEARRLISELRSSLQKSNNRLLKLEKQLNEIKEADISSMQKVETGSVSKPPFSQPHHRDLQKEINTQKRLSSYSDSYLYRTHKVQPGETLFSIARVYYPDRSVGEGVRLILDANSTQLTDANKLQPGMLLIIP